MKRSSWFIIIAIVVLLGGLAVVRITGGPRMTDEEQVHALLTKGETAIEQRSLKDAMSCVSRTYKDPSGMKYEQLRVQAIQAFQQEGKYDVVLEGTDVSVSGSTATAKSSVTIGLISKGARHPIFSNPVTIRLARETSQRWLVIPVEAWRITSIEGAPFSMGE